MKLQKIIDLLSKYDPDAEIAFQVNGAGPNDTRGCAFKLLEIWERPFDEHPVIFLNITAE